MLTAAEFPVAPSLFTDLHTDARWNPWAREDRAATSNTRCPSWNSGRAPTTFRRLSAKQLDAQLARLDRKLETEHAESLKRQERDCQRYDPETETARTAIDGLASQVCDEENVVDLMGRLPQDRRELMLATFSARAKWRSAIRQRLYQLMIRDGSSETV